MSDLSRIPLEPRQPVLLGVTRGDRQLWARTEVMARDRALVWVVYPTEQALPGGLTAGVEVDLYTWREMDARYIIGARLESRDPDGLACLRLLGARRVQEREYFRVDVSMRAESAVVRDESGRERPLALEVRELSAIGCRVRSDRLLAPGQELQFRICLPGESSPIELRARLVRSVQRPRPSEYACELGATFVDLPDEVRERIIRFALREQRELRRKGLV